MSRGENYESRFSVHVGRPEWGTPAAIVVPKIEHALRVSASIDTGSGIVAYRVLGEPDKLVVYYEGNRHGAGNLQTLADRALNAYGRMAKSYPTIACAMLNAALFEAVGEIGTEGHYEIDAAAPVLQAWVAHAPGLMGQPAAHVLRYRMR